MTELEHSHEHEAIRVRLKEEAKPSYVRDFVYGGIDGAITTFAVVAGVVGAELSATIILILGFANLLADGFSMAAANYSGTKTVIDDIARIRAIEERHIAEAPEGEREEVRQILAAKGLDGEVLETAVQRITANRSQWINLMVTEEYGLSLTLGGGEVKLLDMAYAFSVMDNMGVMIGQPVPEEEQRLGFRQLEPVSILRVEDRNGQIIYEYSEPSRRAAGCPRLPWCA